MGELSRGMADLGPAYLYVFLGILVVAMAMGSLRNIRLLMLFAGIAGTLHFALQDGLGWTTALTSLLTVVALAQVVLQHQRAKRGFTSVDEQRLIEDVLQVNEPADQQHLLDLLEWRELEPGDTLVRQGQAEPPLVYIASGHAKVDHDEREVGTCGPGEFVGEMSVVAGECASATVTSTETMRVALIDRDGLLVLTRGVPEIGRAFDRALNRGLSAKVRRMNDALAGNRQHFD